MTACSFAVWAHVCWNWAVRAARTAIPRFIPAPMLNMSRSLGTRRRGSMRRLAGLLCNDSSVDIDAFFAARNHMVLAIATSKRDSRATYAGVKNDYDTRSAETQRFVCGYTHHRVSHVHQIRNHGITFHHA